MVELLVTISLIVILMSMLAVGTASYLKSAENARTESIIKRVSLYIDTYHSKYGGYPTDGLDGDDLITPEGSYLTGGAALTYTLTQPILITKTLPNGEVRVLGKEEPIGEFRSDEISAASEGDDAARQILDAWYEPIHYDDVSKGIDGYSPQSDGETHLDWDEDEFTHSEDPRDLGERSIGTGPQHIEEYDIWSHGSSGHTPEELYEEMLSNWQGE